ncbi:putative Histidine kinase [Candidatus Nitrospira inopinata]|jgi:PAS domain S-box-containing protein|uniref:histidine kinase n=2 Tax=Candidatus Nitrospira inopinata TaxID=1715989 RepID=A0A0S4L0K4_9BACT|nr:putative Histidine kinase [Candidatus Nitrospira inopinata]
MGMTFWSRFHSLQRKIIAAIVVVGLLPLTLFLILLYLEERRALRETTGANFKEAAVEAARRVEMQVTRTVNEAQQLATMPFLRAAVLEANRTYEGKDSRAIEAIIKDWQRRWGQRDSRSEFPLFVNRISTNSLIRWHEIRKSDYVGILVTDEQGALVISSIPQVEYWYKKTAWWRAVVQDGGARPYVGDVAFDPAFGTHVVTVAVPIMDEGQKTAIGAITILLRRDTVFHSIAEVSLGATGHAMLVGSDGVVVLCPVLAPEAHTIRPEVVGLLGALKPGWASVDDDSHGSEGGMIGYAPVRFADGLAAGSLGGRHWLVVVRQDPGEIFAPLGELMTKILLFGGTVLAVLGGIGVVMAGRIAGPIKLLQEGAREIGSGRLDRRLDLKTGDEIEQLAEAFNHMAANLQRSFGQIERQMADVKQLEERYRDLIEHSPEMIYQMDRGGRFVHVNKTGLDKLGYTLEEMLALRLWEVVPKGEEPRTLHFLEQLVSRGQGSMETLLVAKDGRSIDVEIHATALLDRERGGLIYSRAFVRDVTERRRLEQELHRYTAGLEQAVSERTRQLAASQARYKALFDLVADSVFMIDARGMIAAVNKREEQVLGYAEAGVVGRNILDLIAEDRHREFKEWLAEIGGGHQRVLTREIAVMHCDGRVVPVEMNLIGAGGADRDLVMVQMRDITDRKKLERQLESYREDLEIKVRERTREIEETKQYLENLLENANDVIYTLDTEQRFTYVNGKVGAWGYRKDDLLGRPYLSLLSRRHRGRRLKATLDIGAKQVYEVEIVTKRGEIRTAMISVSPLQGAEGRILGVLGIARDMTETKKLEQQIRNAEKLASIGKLAAGVAHEINNPLGGILNCLYNLRKGGISPARQEEYWASMEHGVRRVQKIVRQLLDFSQQHEPEFSPADINQIVERVLTLTTHLFAPNRIALETELGLGLPNVMVDSHMIEQVLMNLILNAVQAMKNGGVLTIRTSIAEGVCRVEVRDTGSGIPPSILPRVFDPFFTTKGEGEGTGLGLSVNLGIVERHGGRILVDSEVGKGTTFTLCLPVSRDHSLVERAP